MMKQSCIYSITFLLLYALVSGPSYAQQRKQYAKKQPIRVLMVGGGSSHDFDRWYREADAQTLAKDGLAQVQYTDQPDSIPHYLKNADVLMLTNNQPISTAEARQAIMAFVEAGKGLILAHAATWYNWEDWPEYNARLVSGGSRGHDKYGKFEVKIEHTRHPLTKNSPKQFSLADERYYLKPDPKGAGMEVLATAHAEGSDDSYPVLWISRHPKARIVGFTLGHDAASHELPVYHTLLRNAVSWVGEEGIKD